MCSEFMGADYTACCLGSINLYNCIENKFTPQSHLNINKLRKLTEIGVFALNQVLDYGAVRQPLEENVKAIRDWRNIGLGFFGFADALVALGCKYGSPESIDFATLVADTMMKSALKTSNELANTTKPFDKYDWNKTKKAPFIEYLKDEDNSLYEDIKKYGLANGSLISIAPTGTLALLVGETGGIEPFFKVSYDRTTHSLEGKHETFKVFPTSIKELLQANNLPLTLTNEEIQERFPYIVTAHEIPYLDRIKVQQAIQYNIDNAISSTINLPHNSTPDDIYDIYIHAWKAGLKGITVFRDGCKRASILNPKKAEKAIQERSKFGEILPIKREIIGGLPSVTYKKQSACSKLYITITFRNRMPFEVFASITGGCTANISTIVRLTSLALRCGIKPEKIVEELSQQKCPACQTLKKQGKENIAFSCGNAIAECLTAAINSKVSQQVVTSNKSKEKDTDDSWEREPIKCPECGREVRVVGKCFECICGWSKCE